MRLPPSVVSLAPAPSTLAGSLTTNSTRLLVSVRDSREAQLARRSGVPWIDLKDPDNGSLGAAGEAIAAAVAGELRASDMLPESLISAAVGELRDEPLQTALRLAQYFPLLKVGLAGVQADAQWQRRWLELAKQIDGAGAELVPVIYADHALCGTIADRGSELGSAHTGRQTRLSVDRYLHQRRSSLTRLDGTCSNRADNPSRRRSGATRGLGRKSNSARSAWFTQFANCRRGRARSSLLGRSPQWFMS